MKPKIKVAFASGTDELNRRLIQQMRAILPELPLYVVSDFPPEEQDLKWIRYRVNRGFMENLRRCREELRGVSIRLAAVMLVPGVPFRRMRLIAILLSPLGFLAFNENLNHFMLRPRSLPAIVRHLGWRITNALRWMLRSARTADWHALLHYSAARLAGFLRPKVPRVYRNDRPGGLSHFPMQPGITVVIPSRNGKDLLAAQLPGIVADLAAIPNQIVVVDNGSSDGTVSWLSGTFPQVELEVATDPLSFARAVNRGIARARFSHICLLNNDMLLEPGFFAALRLAFEQVPDLFSATAQIRFPEGVRREETGKTAMAQSAPEDFPVRCDVPLLNEDLSYVLYGSGGCSLYDAAKLRTLGNVDEVYEPAYVEDLDLGYRAWQQGWPSVYAANAVVEHRHRATTSKYFTQQQLEHILEINYLKFLARTVASGVVFRRLWAQAVNRLWLRAGHSPTLLREAAAIALGGGRAGRSCYSEDLFLALTDGSVSVFPGRAATGQPRVLIVSPYLPFPLSHGAAVRMYNLIRRAATGLDQILVTFTEHAAPPPPELLEICTEVVLVRRTGSHSFPHTGRPEVVEEFDSPAFRAALQQTVRKWRPAVVQLEFTQMAQYAADCAPARTLLVEHDVTFALYEQLLSLGGNSELRDEAKLWRRFETGAWQRVDCVVTMSEKDRRMVTGSRAVIVPNGVDLDRFRPAARDPEPRHLLFIGSFAHRPNVLAVEFFLNQVWPLLRACSLHIIAGAHHERFPVAARLAQSDVDPNVKIEGFVEDVRPAYERAAVVLAPLVASAGTNIKVLEAMAMGKAVVSTPAGVNGLDLAPGEDFVLVETAGEMAAAIERLLASPAERREIEAAARRRVERDYGWDAIARKQAALYSELSTYVD